ncbi:MAG: hypothetical protein M5U26_16885 [Planctomycetota bacterium]|nr:hypothetical protein [Planctomycetota bacterium]
MLELDFFAAEPLSAQPGSGETAFAYSPELVFDPPYGFAPYTLLWAEPQPLELDDAALGDSSGLTSNCASTTSGSRT